VTNQAGWRLGRRRFTATVMAKGLMENERTQTAKRAPTTRSKLTNRPRKQVVSGNSAQGRRLLDMADAFAERLGGWSALSDMTAANVRKAAELLERRVSTVGRVHPHIEVKIVDARDALFPPGLPASCARAAIR
jgi:hypothetical protein